MLLRHRAESPTMEAYRDLEIEMAPTELMACNPFHADQFATTDFQFVYEVETLHFVEDFSWPFAQILPKVVQGAAVESVHFATCAIGLDESVGAHEANTVVRVAQCLYSISTAEYHELTYCQDARIPNCVAFQGDLKIFHKIDCEADLDTAVTLALEQGADQVEFLTSVNTRLTDYDNAVKRVTVLELPGSIHHTVNNGEAVAPTASSEAHTMALGGYVALVLAAILVCVLTGLGYQYYRSQKFDFSPSIKCVSTQDEEEEGTHPSTDDALDHSDGTTAMLRQTKPCLGPRFYDEDYIAREDCVEAIKDPNSLSPGRNPFRRNRRGVGSVSFVRAAGTGLVSSDSEEEERSVESCDE